MSNCGAFTQLAGPFQRPLPNCSTSPASIFPTPSAYLSASGSDTSGSSFGDFGFAGALGTDFGICRGGVLASLLPGRGGTANKDGLAEEAHDDSGMKSLPWPGPGMSSAHHASVPAGSLNTVGFPVT